MGTDWKQKSAGRSGATSLSTPLAVSLSQLLSPPSPLAALPNRPSIPPSVLKSAQGTGWYVQTRVKLKSDMKALIVLQGTV